MNQDNAYLLTLIQLHEGSLSAAQGVLVRERLASDSLWRQRWKALSHLYQTEPRLKQIEQTDAIEPELIAAFVEQRMSPEKREKFEESCWNHPTALREVIAAYQATLVDDPSLEIPAEYQKHSQRASRRMLKMTEQQCSKTESVQDVGKYFQEIKEHQQPGPETASCDPFEDEEEIKPAKLLPLPRRAASKHEADRSRRKITRQRWILMAGAAVVILLALPAYYAVYENGHSDTPIADHSDSRNSPSVHKAGPPKENNPSDSTTVSEHDQIVKAEKNLLPNSPEKISAPPVMNKTDNEKPVVAKKENRPEDSNLKTDLQIVWTQISGIIACRVEGSLPWKGILSDTFVNRTEIKRGNLNATQLSEQIALRTLPLSWLQGEIELGPALVMAADSEIQLSIRQTKENVRQKPEATRNVVELELHSGKVAFSNLQSGDIVSYRDGTQQWNLLVVQGNTSFGVVHIDDKTEQLMTFSGEIRIEEEASGFVASLKSQQVVVKKERKFGKPAALKKKQIWQKQSAQSLSMSKSVIDQLNRSENLLASLTRSPAGKVFSGSARNEVLLSTNLGFALDPATSVPQAAVSKLELQRTAAIQWLLASADDQTTQIVWRKIGATTNAGQSMASVRKWFKAARGSVPVSQKLLVEFSMGLANKDSLFVRQCSIHFLRQITSQPLAEYDPSAPTKASVESARQKARRTTNSNRKRRR